MAVYAIGDVQGCYEPLRELLGRINFVPARDTLWFTGDLVNRGPDSLAVLRFVSSLPNAVSVLGNHDLHLLAVAAGQRGLKRSDTFDDVLAAPDREALLGWLRRRPLFHRDTALGYGLVHAGLLPAWDIDTAERLAREAESRLRSDEGIDLLGKMYGDEPCDWDESLSGDGRFRVIVNGFTRLRYCNQRGAMDLTVKVAPAVAPAHLVPWFQHPRRRAQGLRVVFGHWSTLGFWDANEVIGIDTGCLWGGELCAIRLDRPQQPFRVGCPQSQLPGRT